MNRIRGLDAIRFVCAFWVMLGHYSLPIPQGHEAGSPLLRFLDGGLHAAIWGVPAVMIFFVISGFCIHYPFRHGETPQWGEYFVRRYIRIGIPLLAAVLLVWFFKGDLSPVAGVIWSLYAEIIYYTLYPLLMLLRRRFGWRILFTAAALAALVVIVSDLAVPTIQEFGVARAWIVGLPVWLIGCRLAEEADTLTAARIPRLWLWRTAIWAASCIYGLLRFHSSFPASGALLLFAVLVFFWLRQEIRHFRFQAPPAFLEKAGAWSYSLYLMHNFAGWCFARLHLSIPGRLLPWLFQIALALALSYLFFLLVERPAHWLARQARQKPGRNVTPSDGETKPRPESATVV